MRKAGAPKQFWGCLAMTLACLSSCAYGDMYALPDKLAPKTHYECTESVNAARVDLAFGILGIALIGQSFLCGAGTDTKGCGSRVMTFNAGLGLAIGSLESAHYGYTEASRCRDYNAGRLSRFQYAVEPKRPIPSADQVGMRCERIPGVRRGGRCPAGLVCRGDTCLP